jgi:hypothetical protein
LGWSRLSGKWCRRLRHGDERRSDFRDWRADDIIDLQRWIFRIKRIAEIR